jgi:hypothetical protein
VIILVHKQGFGIRIGYIKPKSVGKSNLKELSDVQKNMGCHSSKIIAISESGGR